MRIISLELVKYKRMVLNNIDSFTFRPVQMIQLILGTNGSGKSSLVKELSPLPADAADYLKEGSKTIRISNRGNTYILKSTFNPSQKHSFLENGEEKNPGGTITVQKELVWQYFHINHEIHELLTGIEVFHSMSPSRRREWFTQLSDTSYDYALGVFTKLKERSRDLTGALKLAKKRLVTETSQVISAEEEEKLRHDVDLTHAELNLLMMQSAPIDRPMIELEDEQQRNYEELTRLSNRLLRMRFVAPYGTYPYGSDPRRTEERDEWGESVRPSFSSIDDIDAFLDDLRHQITSKETLINQAVTQHTKISETVQVLTRTGEEGVKSLQDKIDVLRAQKTAILARRKLKIEGLDANNAMSALDSVYDVLVATFSTIPENEDKRFNGARLKELQALLYRLKDRKTSTAAQLARAESQKAHIEAHKTDNALTCPQCHHTWIIDYSVQKHAAILAHIAELKEQLDTIEKETSTAEADMTAIKEYSEVYRDYARCVKNWPILQPFWDYMLEGQFVTRSPRKALAVLESFRFDLELEQNAKRVEDEIDEVKSLILSAAQLGDANLADQKLKLEECSHAIDQMTAALTKLQSSLADYGQYKRQLQEGLELGAKINSLTIMSEKLTQDMIETMRRETLNHCVRQLQSSLAMKMDRLSAIEIKKGIIGDLEKQVTSLTLEEEAAKLLVKELSPTEGLIAEGLLGFIRNFVGQMNALIRKIWTYPLQVMDCGVSGRAGAELDYKFRLMVQTKTNIVPDVKLGSSGMREIVNLAFKVVAMRYLGLAESPLFLDEFGKALDKEHRNAASVTIKSLMDTQPFTQLFMISHYEEGYGSFTNAEICVLDPRNITVPGEYNQHVTIA